MTERPGLWARLEPHVSLQSWGSSDVCLWELLPGELQAERGAGPVCRSDRAAGAIWPPRRQEGGRGGQQMKPFLTVSALPRSCYGTLTSSVQ